MESPPPRKKKSANGREIRDMNTLRSNAVSPNSYQYTVGIVPGGENLPESPKTEGIGVYRVRRGQCAWPLKIPGMVCGAAVTDKRSEYCEECKQILQARIERYHDVLELYLFVNRFTHTKGGESDIPHGISRAERGVDHAMSGVRHGRASVMSGGRCAGGGAGEALGYHGGMSYGDGEF